ncbi:EAL domain-containing protein [Hahella sp. HN01]|nr:EAL domain-containing protein [Hahella sp. HN01]
MKSDNYTNMHPGTNDIQASSLKLMSTMARPKPLMVRREQLIKLGRRSRHAAALLFLITMGFVATAFPHQAIEPLICLTALGAFCAVLLVAFGSQAQAQLQNESANLPRNVANLSRLYVLLSAIIATVLGPITAYVIMDLPASWLDSATIAQFVGAGLLSFFLGVWRTPFIVLSAMPLLWLAVLLNGRQPLPQELLTNAAILSVFLYPLAALWYLASSRYLNQNLQMQGLIAYLDNARSASEQLNQQLAHEITYREEIEQELRETQKELEGAICERTHELSEANRILSQQIKLRKNISDALMKSQTRLSQAIEATGLALWDWDIPRNSLYQSFFHDAFGPREMSATAFVERMHGLIHPDDRPRIRKEMMLCLKGLSNTYRVQYRVITAKDAWIWVEDCGKPVSFDKLGRITRMIGSRRDISKEKSRDEQLLLAKSVFDHTPQGVFALDTEFRFLTVNNAFSQITGYETEEVIGSSLEDFSQAPNKRQVFSRIRDELSLRGRWQGELYEKRKSGEFYCQWLQITSIINTEGATTHYAGLFSDLTERKQADEKLHYLLNYDELTGLANRMLFRERLDKILRKVREQGLSINMLLLNVDRFRQVNESLGQDRGDELLKQVATRISQTASHAHTLARLGSDEFAILTPAKSRSQMSRFCEQLLDELKAPFNIDGHEFYVSTSIGVTQAPDNGWEIQTLMQQANMAVRQAKYLGGNTYEFYSRMLRSMSRMRLEVETELRRAIQNQQMEVFFQPKLSLDSGRITGVEALARWRHPQRGLIGPSDFVPMAEESGLITELGEQMLGAACAQAAAWSREGLDNIQVSVNLSAHQLRQSNLPQLVRKVLQDTDLPPHLLDLELTESTLMENMGRTQFMLSRLREMGVRITVDDFGTGYSSLSYLKRFPLNALKIDRMFIKDAHQNADDAAITRAVIMLGKSLNLEVIAEGVEHEGHLEFLRESGCHTVQGYLIAEPLGAEQMANLLREQCTGSPALQNPTPVTQ